jgi:hypothetical protein
VVIADKNWKVVDASIFGQNDVARKLYEGRLKAARDLQTLETRRNPWDHRYFEAQDRLD